ncbi:MAG TPA: GlsB/YeaQ/YmgE family stress response membrane protein, partial [Povalibacter sp.]
MQIYAPERIYLNVAVGVVGAVFGGWLLPPLLRISSINPGSLNIGGVFVSCLGAVVLLAIVDLGRRSAARIKR